jgi:hypothetical protein
MVKGDVSDDEPGIPFFKVAPGNSPERVSGASSFTQPTEAQPTRLASVSGQDVGGAWRRTTIEPPIRIVINNRVRIAGAF